MLSLLMLCICFVPVINAQSVYTLSQLREARSAREDLMHLGNHVVAEFTGCENLDAHAELEAVLREAAQAAHATVIEVVTHKFSPMGMSGIVLLAESHISIHTWPEHGYVAVDIYTCGDHVDINAAIDVLVAFFQPNNVAQITIDRGCERGHHACT